MGISIKRSMAFATALALVVSVMVLLAPPALAHHPILSGEASCNPATFQWEVKWTLANGNWSGRTMTVDQVGYPDGQLAVIAVGLELVADASVSETAYYPLSDSGVKTLEVRADWAGGSQNVSRSLSIDLSLLDPSRCQPGQIVIEKKTIGGVGTFSFSSRSLPSSVFDVTTTAEEVAESKTFSQLATGTYDVAEATPPANWQLTSATCSDESNPSSISLSAGETVTCTFTNEYTPPPLRATIVIRKVTVGGVGAFGFTLTEHGEGTSATDFNLTTPSVGVAVEEVFADASTQSWYSVAEDSPLPSGWALTSTECVSDSLAGDEITAFTSADEFGVAPGETVTCTFTNTYTSPPTTPPFDTPVSVVVGAVCETDASTGHGLGVLRVTVTPAGGATVSLPGATKLRDGVYTIPEGSAWSWSATANPGFLMTNPASGSGTIDSCSVAVLGTTIAPTTTVAVSPATLPFTGSGSGATLAIGGLLAGLGLLVVISLRREEEEISIDL